MNFKKPFVGLVFGVVLAVVLTLAGLSAFFFVAGRDIDPPDVSDVLPPPRQPIADAENMVPILLDATNRLALTKDDKYFINCCYRKDGWDRRLRLADGDRTLTAMSAFYRESNRVMLAMTRFRRKCKRNPQSLSELVPEFMTEVPRDPFDADIPLGYNFEQGTLHTVGANGTFNGKVRDPRLRFGGLRNPDYRYIRRIDGRSMEPPLKEKEIVLEGKSSSKEK